MILRMKDKEFCTEIPYSKTHKQINIFRTCVFYYYATQVLFILAYQILHHENSNLFLDIKSQKHVGIVVLKAGVHLCEGLGESQLQCPIYCPLISTYCLEMLPKLISSFLKLT